MRSSMLLLLLAASLQAAPPPAAHIAEFVAVPIEGRTAPAFEIQDLSVDR